MRIALLGGNGQVGFELRRSLAPLGPLCVALRALPAHADAQMLELDLAQPGQSVRLRDFRPDVIVNAAAYTAVDRAESEFELAARINHHAVAELAALSRQLDALLVHYSTDYVFPGDADRPYREDATTGPSSVYGHSKLDGEQAISASGCQALILRTAWVYASRGQNFLRTMLRLAGERDQLRIVADQHGTPTPARLIADTTAQMLSHWQRSITAQRSDLHGIHHLTASGQTTWHGFAEALLNGAQQRGLIERVPTLAAISSADYPTPAQRPAWSVLDCSRLSRQFGLHLPQWQQGLDTVLDELVASRA